MVSITEAGARRGLVRGTVMALAVLPVALLAACAQQPPPPPPQPVVYDAAPPPMAPAPMVPRARG